MGRPRQRPPSTWYEPLREQADIDLAAHWVLGRPEAFLLTTGDVEILPRLLDAAERFERRPADEEMAALVDRAGRNPVVRLACPPPRSWSCGCPYADCVPIRANHNSKIAVKGGGDPVILPRSFGQHFCDISNAHPPVRPPGTAPTHRTEWARGRPRTASTDI